MCTENESYSLKRLPDESSSVIKDCNVRGDEDILTKAKSNKNISITKSKAFLGIFYLTLTSVFIQSISVIVKKVSYISTCQLSLIRYTEMFVLLLPLAIYFNKQILGEERHRVLLVLRGILAANGLFFQIVAYRYLELIEASIVMATFPFATAVIARILLKEPLGLTQTIAIITTICGVLLSLRLPEALSHKTYTHFDISFVIGLVISVLSVLCLALSTVAIRKLNQVHFSIIMLYTSFFGMIENAALNGTVFPLVAIECGWDQIFCMLIGIFGTAGTCFLTLATQVEPAGIVAVQFSSLDILITVVFQILFFSKYPDVYVISGVCLVIASLIITGVKHWVLIMPESSQKRQKLKWILL